MKADGVLREHTRLSERVIDLSVDAGSRWFKWFWRLGAVPKLIAVGAHVVAVYLAVTWLHLGSAGLKLVRLVALALVFLAIASLLFGHSRRSDEP